VKSLAENKENGLTISISKVKTYKQCPRRYYYSYIEKLPKQDWDHFTLGTFVHGVLEHFHNEYKEDPGELNLKKLMKECFFKQKEKMDLDKPIAKEILNEAHSILSIYLKNIEEKGIGSKVLKLEEEFVVYLNEKHKLKGVIDRTDLDKDGILHIKDYKTNKNTKYMDHEQLRAYGIFLLKNNPNIELFRGSYIMLRFGTLHLNYDFNLDDVDKAKKDLVSYAEKISEDERWLVKPSKLCDWCDFKNICFNSWD
jgi:RecB family exonuclease